MELLIVSYQCREGRREDFLKVILEEGIRQACLKEPGNISYDYFFSAQNENELLLVERWEDPEALERHHHFPHFRRLGEMKEEYVAETRVERYSV